MEPTLVTLTLATTAWASWRELAGEFCHHVLDMVQEYIPTATKIGVQ